MKQILSLFIAYIVSCTCVSGQSKAELEDIRAKKIRGDFIC